MRTKASVGINKQAIVVKDLKTSKNPRGGAPCTIKLGTFKVLPSGDCNSGLQGVSTTR